MLFFKTRKLAREFARKREQYKVVDFGKDADRRWAVKVLK